MKLTKPETYQHRTGSEAGTGTGEKRTEANTGSKVPNDEEKATDAVARASLEVLKQASKILMPPTL